jgi:hypothetical protein
MISILITTTFLSFIFLYQNLISATPQLSVLAQKVGQPVFAIAFNYLKTNKNKLHFIQKTQNLERNIYQKNFTPFLEDLEARGFFIFDIEPRHSKNLFLALDEILNDFLNFIDTEPFFESQDLFDLTNFYEKDSHSMRTDFLKKSFLKKNLNNINFSPENNSDEVIENPFSKPLTNFLENLWNGETLLLGGVTELQLSLKDSILLGIEEKIKKINYLPASILKKIILNNSSFSTKDFLKKYPIDISTKYINFDLNSKINHSEIVLSINNTEDLLDSICSLKINPHDFCAKFRLKRDFFRKNMNNIIFLFNKNFTLTFNFYWATVGKTFIYSNQKSFVEKIVDTNVSENSENILTSVSASGADFLLPTKNLNEISSITFLFDMVLLQNKIIHLAELTKKQSNVLADYFSSPNGEEIFSKFEQTVNILTSYSEKASFSIERSTKKIINKIRLFSPSGNLFFNRTKGALKPEFSNNIKNFMMKIISIEYHFIPEGDLPISGPFLQKNGKWFIIQSEISLKLLLPFLENRNPFIDNYDDPEKL